MASQSRGDGELLTIFSYVKCDFYFELCHIKRQKKWYLEGFWPNYYYETIHWQHSVQAQVFAKVRVSSNVRTLEADQKCLLKDTFLYLRERELGTKNLSCAAAILVSSSWCSLLCFLFLWLFTVFMMCSWPCSPFLGVLYGAKRRRGLPFPWI